MPENTSPHIKSDLIIDVEALVRELKEAARGLGAYHLQACVKCGLCGETCHVYLSDPCIENLPGRKAEKVSRIYRRYFTLLGRFLPRFVGASELTPEILDDLVESVYGRCTGCGRCGMQCSIGTDVGAIIRVGRNLAALANKIPKNLDSVVKAQLTTGNQMSITREELIETAAWLSEDLQQELNDNSVRIPVDEKGCRVMYLVNPREVKFFPLSLSAAAGLFHVVKESWTLSSRFYDVTNYGFFSGHNKDAARITKQALDEAKELGVEEIILSECGHGFRSFRWEGANWMRSHEYPPMRSILHLMKEYLDLGKINVDPALNPEPVTLHDPCNLVRWGGVSEPQREILKKCVTNFIEMTPNREQNFCCGGGGGMLSMSEYGDRRIASGNRKAEQIKATGAKIVATPCHNCADQLLEISKKYKLGVQILSVVELVYNALVKSGEQ